MSSPRVSASPQANLECLEVSILSRSDGSFCLLSQGDEVVLRVQPLALGNAMMITESPVTLLLGEQGPPRPVDKLLHWNAYLRTQRSMKRNSLLQVLWLRVEFFLSIWGESWNYNSSISSLIYHYMWVSGG